MKKTFLFLSVMTLILLLLGFSGVEAGQGSRTPPRIGILIPESLRPESQAIKGLRDGLKELGYKEEKNILVEIRNAKGDRAALKPAVDELVGKKFNLIFTTGTRATQAAKTATTEIPIVFTHPADPVALGLVKSMEHPGGNITGVAGLASQMTGKRMEALKQTIPNVRRVHIFFDANNKFSQENFASAQKEAQKLGIEVAAHGVKAADELKSSLGQLQKTEGDVLFHVPDDLVEGQVDFIFEMARQKGLPTMFNEEVWVIKGALAGFGPSYYQMGRQASRLVDKILKGQSAGEIPVERAVKFDLVINFRVANTMGLTIPPSVLKKADKVIR